MKSLGLIIMLVFGLAFSSHARVDNLGALIEESQTQSLNSHSKLKKTILESDRISAKNSARANSLKDNQQSKSRTIRIQIDPESHIAHDWDAF